MVECDLPKVEIAGSSPVSRSVVTKGMFWKRFYFVVVLLSCNCFLLCCNGFCKLIKEVFGCGQSETTNDSDNGQADNKDNKNIYNNNITTKANNIYKWGDADLNNSGISYNEFKNIDFSKLIILIPDESTPSPDISIINFKTCFCSATDHRVGKTSIFKVAKQANFDKEEGCTFAPGFFCFDFIINDNTLMKMQVWDTASASHLQSITKAYYKNENAIVLVYDITNVDSFNNLNDYIKEVKKKAAEGVVKVCSFFLLGNKLDLVGQDQEKRQIKTVEAKNFAESNDLIFLGECSAKENTYMPVAENTCYKQEELKDGNCSEGVSGIFKDILSNIVKKQKFQGE